MAIEDTYLEVKNEDINKKRFVDLYTIDPELPIDPLSKVVPTTEEEFFGTFALNILVFTKLYLNEDDEWDNEQYSASKQRLIATFDKFAKYGLYVFIDGSTFEISHADGDKYQAFEDLITQMATDLADYGVTFVGYFESQETLKSAIESTIESFFTSTLNYNF